MNYVWTDQRPTKPGWYWWRSYIRGGNGEFCVCQEVILIGKATLYAPGAGNVDILSGHWSSTTIDEPKEAI